MSDARGAGRAVLAGLGSVLLAAGAGFTIFMGLLSALLTDSCRPGATEPWCRNADLVLMAMTWPVAVFALLVLLLTWVRGPRVWPPVFGLIVLTALWVTCDAMVDGHLI